MNISPSILAGVSSLLNDYLSLAPTDAVVVAYTPDSLHAAAWVSAGVELLLSLPVHSVPMSPLHDADFERRLRESLAIAERAGASRTFLLMLENGTASHSAALRAATRNTRGHTIVVRSISSTSALFEQALSIPRESLFAWNATLLHAIHDAEHLSISTEGGTRLEASLAPRRYRWINNSGTIVAGQTLVLPPGEVATYPASISGTLVADLALNANTLLPGVDARLGDHPVTVEIVNGRAVSFTCDNPTIHGIVNESFSVEDGDRVGELGFGTNRGIRHPTPANSHINERFPGVHIGFGQHNQGEGVSYRCPRHLDLICRGGLVKARETSAIDLSAFDVVERSPPSQVKDSQDVFESGPAGRHDDIDCCGIADLCGSHVA